MDEKQIKEIVAKQRKFFSNGNTLSVDFRIEMLTKLKKAIKIHEHIIANALNEDLGKSDFESYMCETGMVLEELSYMIKHVKSFAKNKRVRTPLSHFPAKSYTFASPYGSVLIMSPWNYPFLLTMVPLIDAISAGNTAIVKPSAYAPATGAIIEEILADTFEPEYVAVVMGGRQENSSLLKQKYDMIFFTGSVEVGKEVLRNSAENLTPVVLELGGKSPCIVDKSANIALTARRLVFGKFLNCGQTCIAPDYVLCHESVKDKLVKCIIKEIEKQFSPKPLLNIDYGKIINAKHFDRIVSLIDKDKVVFGGDVDKTALRIAPTVMDNVTIDDRVMSEEIFGPILPILTYSTNDELMEVIDKNPTPLALYLFSNDKNNIKYLTTRIQYGGGCINDTIMHIATPNLPFGGVGRSGIGAYHGRAGFDAFSHTKSMIKNSTWIDAPIRYQPYSRGLYTSLVHLFLR